MSCEYLDLADFLLVAEAVLDIELEALISVTKLPLAESALAAPQAEFSGTEFYPELAMKAAVLCSRIIQNHPLPDGNKRVGFLCLLEFLERNGIEIPVLEVEQTVATIERVAAGEIDESELAQWIDEIFLQG